MGFSFICICPWDSNDGNLPISQFYTTFHRAETSLEADLYFSRLQQSRVPKFSVIASAATTRGIVDFAFTSLEGGQGRAF